MKRKKNYPEKFQHDKYQDGPKKPASSKLLRPYRDDDDDLDEVLAKWSSMRRWSDEEE
jgi:hypothetical protein